MIEQTNENFLPPKKSWDQRSQFEIESAAWKSCWVTKLYYVRAFCYIGISVQMSGNCLATFLRSSNEILMPIERSHRDWAYALESSCSFLSLKWVENLILSTDPISPCGFPCFIQNKEETKLFQLSNNGLQSRNQLGFRLIHIGRQFSSSFLSSLCTTMELCSSYFCRSLKIPVVLLYETEKDHFCCFPHFFRFRMILFLYWSSGLVNF